MVTNVDTATWPPPNLGNLERPELAEALATRGLERFRADQLFQWIYRHSITNVSTITVLTNELRRRLAAEFTLTTPELVHRERSVDGTEKFLLRLSDGQQMNRCSFLTRPP